MEEAHPEGIQDRDANPSPHVVDDTPPPLAWASVLWPDRSYLVRSMVVLELAGTWTAAGSVDERLRRRAEARAGRLAFPPIRRPSSRRLYRAHVRGGCRFSWPEHRRCNGDGGSRWRRWRPRGFGSGSGL